MKTGCTDVSHVNKEYKEKYVKAYCKAFESFSVT